MSKPHLSFTALSMLMRCGEQYRWRYVEGIRSPPGIALTIGKGVHGAVEHDLGKKMETGELLADDAIADYAADATKEAWERENPVLQPGETLGEAVDTAVSLAQVHHRELAPVIEPIALEKGFVLGLDGFPFDLMGYIDIEEATRLRDTKTSSKAPPADAAETSYQLTLYHLNATVKARQAGHASETGVEPKTVALDYLVKGKNSRAITLEAKRTVNDHARLLRLVERAADIIEKQAFVPTTPDNWCCSERFCGWYDRCDFGAKKKVTVGLIDPSRLTSRVAERRP